MKITNISNLLINGKLLKYTSIGTYPLYYVDSYDSCLCAECATDSIDDELPKFRPIAVDINYENNELYCDQCSTRIESAYGEED